MLRTFRLLAPLLLSMSAVGNLAAQRHALPQQPVEYLALIERASQNEANALEDPVPFQFTERLTWGWGTETRSVIETPEGRADRIVLFHDEPLAPDQQEKQKHRLEKLLRDRDAVKNELQDWKSEMQHRIRMVKAFPQAVLFLFDGREDNLLRFSFRPNPAFSPKDRETQLYRGMEGFVWIEPKQERIVRVSGKLVKDVSFGWGVLGHLNKGGIYEIAQTEVTPGTWRTTTMNVDVKGRIFLVSGFRFYREEQDTDYRVTPESVHYHDAVEALLTFDVPSLEKGRHRPKSTAARSNSVRSSQPAKNHQP